MTSNPVLGDEASHTLQALSIANDLDLEYDKQDGKYWKDLNWSEHPAGLLFQEYSGGYAFAKPYGYSLFLAAFIFLFGKAGFVIGNVLIFGLINVFVFLALRSFYGELETCLLTVAFTFFSYLYMYVFYVHSDLFLAMLSSLFVFLLTRLFVHPTKLYFTALCLVAAFIASEKIAAVLVMLPALLLYFYKAKSFRTVVGFGLIFTAGFLLFIFPYLHYSDYKSWNPYKGKRFYASSSKPFSFDSDKPASSYRAVSTGHHFNLSGIIKRTFDTSRAREKASSFYYYFFGAYTGMIVFIPFAFITILYSIFLVLKKPDSRLVAPLIGLFSYILFYAVLFHTNYYGGGQSLGNRYFLQISPFVILLISGLGLGRRGVYSIVILSLGLSAMFLYRHHLEPENAYARINKSGCIQAMMPYEKTQRPLTIHYIHSDKMVNLEVYPAPPRGVKCNYVIELKGRKIAIQTTKSRLGEEFHEIDSLYDLFKEIMINGKTQFLNSGFYRSEKTHVWSKEKSAILLRNSQKREYFSLNGLIPDTTIKVRVGEKELIGQAPFSFTVDTRKYKDKWILVCFEADNSGIPSKITKSNDDRELSFWLAYKDNKYKRLKFN